LKSKPVPKDQPVEFEILETQLAFKGRVWDVVSDRFDYQGQPLVRDYIKHPGAVATIALNESRQILMVRQYRHPVRKFLWEIPAGLLDVPGEPLEAAARRELIEETSHDASSWEHLISFHPSPGGNSETITVFLATEVRPISSDYEATGEESDMLVEWVDFDEALKSVLASEIQNPSAVVAILALAARLK
jgi:8-oxo-dGDP phosphatase